jgi:DNA-directed RNA polymerase subunit RPC12/RpoP
MLTCLNCGKNFTKHIENRRISVMGLSVFDIPGLVIYKCDGCGKEILPEESRVRLKNFEREIFENNQSIV